MCSTLPGGSSAVSPSSRRSSSMVDAYALRASLRTAPHTTLISKTQSFASDPLEEKHPHLHSVNI